MKRGSKQSPEALERMRAAAKEWWSKPENRAKKRPSPSAETREKMRQAKLAHPTNYWKGKTRGPQTEEWRARISAANAGKPKPEGWGERIGAQLRGIPRPPEVVEKMREGQKTPEAKAAMRANVLGKPCRHSKHPVFYKGRRMRSTYEVRVAAALDALGIKWEYETQRFHFGTFTYCPDFYLPDGPCFWEVKGWYGPNSKRAVEAFRASQSVPLILVTKESIEALEAAAAKAA